MIQRMAFVDKKYDRTDAPQTLRKLILMRPSYHESIIDFRIQKLIDQRLIVIFTPAYANLRMFFDKTKEYFQGKQL